MSISRIHPKGTPAPYWRVRVQPTNRGPIFIGDFRDESAAHRADDDARIWLHHLMLLRDSFGTGWHDRRRAHRILVLRADPLPECPPKLARWLAARGWAVPGFSSQPPVGRKRDNAAERLHAFLRRLDATETALDRLERRGLPSAPPTQSSPVVLI